MSTLGGEELNIFTLIYDGPMCMNMVRPLRGQYQTRPNGLMHLYSILEQFPFSALGEGFDEVFFLLERGTCGGITVIPPFAQSTHTAPPLTPTPHLPQP